MTRLRPSREAAIRKRGQHIRRIARIDALQTPSVNGTDYERDTRILLHEIDHLRAELEEFDAGDR